jgi:hypothetical protein
MNNNKRQRTDEEGARPAPASITTASRVPKLRLSDELATKLGTRYCTDNEFVARMLSQKMCSRVMTFEVKATLVGDLNEWMPITLDDEHASTADVKAGVEQAKGHRPATQELLRYDESWTGTEGSGGSGHTAAQEDAALVEEGFKFEDPCSLLVSVNESYAVVLEGQEEGEASRGSMGVYERVEGRETNGRGVWQAVGGLDSFLYYDSGNCRVNDGPYRRPRWVVTTGNYQFRPRGEAPRMFVTSSATTPDQITEKWRVCDSRSCLQDAPNVRVRACSSVEKHAAEQHVEQEQARALEQAQRSRQLVFEGLATDQNYLMGVYQLMEGKVVNGRAVWQLVQGGTQELFLYCADNRIWCVSQREHMERGENRGRMLLDAAALTPDRARPSDVCKVIVGRRFEEAAEARFVASHD